MMTFRTTDHELFTRVDIEVEGSLSPQDLPSLRPPQVPATKGVVISGRGPIWLYALLVHEYHPTLWVATHDPRLGGAVVVESHGGPTVGTVVPLEDP